MGGGGAAGLHARGRVTGEADLRRVGVEETYSIGCKERGRRTFLLFLSVKEGMKHSELAPGDTPADAILQRPMTNAGALHHHHRGGLRDCGSDVQVASVGN
jgi:hypothetical protein